MTEFLAPLLSALPPVPVMLSSLAVAAILLLLLGLGMAPLVAVVEEWRFVRTGRSFFKKLARQVGFMAFVPGTLAYLALIACLALLVRDEPELLLPPYREALLLLGSLMLAAYILLALYVLTGNEKREAGFFHHLAGIATVLFTLAALACGAIFLYRVTHTPPEAMTAAAPLAVLTSFYLYPDSVLMPYLLAECLPLGLGAAGALTGVWLILLRNRQDYGRDYYAFALRRAMAWSLAGTILALPLGGLSIYMATRIMLPELSSLPTIHLAAGVSASVLASLFFWLRVMRSQTPMRHKISVFLGLFSLCITLGMQVYAFGKMLPSP